MKKIVLCVTSFLLTVVLTGCAHFTDVHEDSEYLVIAGAIFRKTGAFKADMLWAGVEKTKGWGRVSTFEPKFFPTLQKDIEVLQATEAFNEQTRKAAIEAAAKAGIEIVEGNISGKISSETISTGKYKIFILREVSNFVAELNSDQNRKELEDLMRYPNPHIITSTATVFDRESSRKIEAAGAVTLSIKKAEIGSPEFSIKAKKSGETLAKLSDGTVFAYQYSRICWEKKNGKIRAFTIEVDNPGSDDSCPPGTKDNASKLP